MNWQFIPGGVPVLGSWQEFEEGTNFVTFTWPSLWRPATGKIVIGFVARATVVQPVDDPLPVTLGGVAVTQRRLAQTAVDGDPTRALAYLGTASGLSTASALTLVVDFGRQWGNVAGFIGDLIGWSGSVGATAGAVYSSFNTTTGPTASGVLQQSGKLLIGLGGQSSGTGDPYSASGWTKLTDVQSEPGSAGIDSSCGVWTRTGGTAGDTVNLIPTSGTAYTDWASAWMELY
jgi:hypothetical protein